jgi:hypothetical protein
MPGCHFFVKPPVSICNFIEIVGVCLGFALALPAKPGRVSFARSIAHSFKRLARREILATISVGILAAVASAALSYFVFHPEPFIHDEFSYLLAADTFAHGRLANPAHPMWEHFETFHVIQQPSYASKYPPAQGLMLAVGQVLFGHPVVGVWISVGLACAAICWMLQAWLPPHWALGGALLATSRIVLLGPWVTIGYWSQSYWGGAVAAFGGALVFGAVPRIVRAIRPQGRHSISMAVGLAILANSRPFEGLVAFIPVALLLSRRLPWSKPLTWGRVILPGALVLLPVAGLMVYYNLRVTGNPLRMPYQTHESAYALAPSFVWQDLRPAPDYHHSVMHDFWTGWACEGYLRQRSLDGLVRETIFKLTTVWQFFFGITLTIPLFAIGFAIRERWTQFAALTCGLVLAALCLETGVVPHYAAPITGLLYVLLIQSVRHLHLWRWNGRPSGRVLVNWLGVTYVALIASAIAYATPANDPAVWFRQRAAILDELKTMPEQHLVIVRYAPAHNAHAEWVYNAADIDGAKVVWARDMGAAKNRELIDYFRDRRVWLLEADVSTPQLVSYRDR